MNNCSRIAPNQMIDIAIAAVSEAAAFVLTAIGLGVLAFAKRTRRPIA